jgi:hypothetical protein
MEIKLPQSWDDVTVGMYIELRPILHSDKNEIERLIYILAVLLKKPTQDVEKIKIAQYHEMRKTLSFLWELPLPTELQKYFTIEGNDYEIVLNANELDAGQYMSVVTKLKNASDDPEIVYNQLHEILASISVPVEKVKKKYKRIAIEPSYYKKVAQDFYHHLPMSIAYPIGVFFWNLSDSLTKIIQDSLKSKLAEKMTEAEEIQAEVMRDFLKDGDGGLHSITSLMDALKSGDTMNK